MLYLIMKRLDRVPAKLKEPVESKLREIPRILRERRLELDLTQEDLSEELSISLETMKAIESGRRYPSLPMLFYIFAHMKIKVKFEY